MNKTARMPKKRPVPVGNNHARVPLPSVRPADLGIGVLFATIRDAAVVGDATTGQIVLWNPAAEALFGYSPDEAIGLSLEVLVPERLKREHREGLAHYAATGRGRVTDASEPVELPALRKNGEEITIELSLNPLRTEASSHRYVLAIIRDVTARKRLEAEREALLAASQTIAARQLELARLKADFTAMVAHELASPIAVIRIYAAALGTGELDRTTQIEAGRVLRVEADFLRALVADVHVAATVERDDFTISLIPVPLNLLLDEALAFARTLPGDHPITGPLTVRDRVLADPDRLTQVLRNLLSNAAKFSPAGTPIEIRATPVGRSMRIEVVDRGYGIHPDDQSRVFEKFGRGRDLAGEHVPGLGLGLYLSRRIIRAHGAELIMDSTAGIGSSFGFDLDLVD